MNKIKIEFQDLNKDWKEKIHSITFLRSIRGINIEKNTEDRG